MASKKKSSTWLFPLLVVFALAFYMRSMTLPLRLEGGELQITALLYSDIPSLLDVDEEVKKFTCSHHRLCVGNAVTKVIADEFHAHSGKVIEVTLDFVPPVNQSLMVVEQPQSQLDGMLLIKHFWSEFRQRDRSFFKSDVRLFINIVRKNDRDYSERSLGSAAGRVGFVEWDVAKRPNYYMWNLTKILHELGHVFGADDQYLPGGGSKYPGGYIQPAETRNEPQRFVAIMSGRRPNVRGIKGEAQSLEELKFSAVSARAMGWRH